MRGVASSVVRRALLVLTATRVNLVPSDDQTTWNASNHRSKVILGGQIDYRVNYLPLVIVFCGGKCNIARCKVILARCKHELF
jgi:hypothetical protein